MDPTEQHEPNADPTWLHRQWDRVRHLWARDVVIGQVGEGATNVVIGKNNIQINVGGRNLTLPIYAIAAALSLILALLLYPLVEPIWWPSQMTGPFRIAIANFGEQNSRGQVQPSERGTVLSNWFTDNLVSEMSRADLAMGDALEIWQDARLDSEKNLTFGMMRGDTVEEREASARRLAQRIAAHMVIYGVVVPSDNGPRLDLEFYVAPLVDDETASIVGPHRLGRPLGLPAAFDTDDPAANAAVTARLQVRTRAFFWLTRGLTQEILGQNEAALATFRAAADALTDWRDEDGKEILYFFIGREELFLGNLTAAAENLRRALDLNPTYTRAQIALGSTFLKSARAVPPAERLRDPSLLLQALDAHLHGLELAAQEGDLLLINLANLALAKSYRLLGETYYAQQNVEQAQRFFALTREKVEQVAAPLIALRQFRLAAQAYEAAGAANLQEGVMLQTSGDPAVVRQRLQAAVTAYAACIDQNQQVFDKFLENEVVDAGCRTYHDEAATRLAQLGEK
jgi:tetratricopeptide (TPR) repeat protein